MRMEKGRTGVILDGLAKDVKLVGHAFIIKATATTDTFLQREIGEVVHP